MSRYALLVQYDGTPFNGWQLQDRGRTIQEEFEKAVSIFSREKVRINASGRTDAGVHALGQVIHFDLKNDIPLRKLCSGMNGILPSELSVKNAYSVKDDFHARFSAVQREYIYLIYKYPMRTPFMKKKAMWINFPFEADYVRDVTSHIVGEKDFKSFCKKISQHNGTVRKIESIEVTEQDELIKVRFRANGFLHNMIRIIIGTTVQMYRENRDPSYILEILNQRNRDISGFTAPPYGLYLNKIIYDPPLNFYESAF